MDSRPVPCNEVISHRGEPLMIIMVRSPMMIVVPGGSRVRLPRTRWATAPAALRTTVPFVDAASSTHTPPLAGPSLRWVREIEFVGSGMTNRRSPLVPVGSRPTTRTESTFSRWPESTTSQACTVPGSPVGPVAGAGEGFGGVGGGGAALRLSLIHI